MLEKNAIYIVRCISINKIRPSSIVFHPRRTYYIHIESIEVGI